MIWKFPVPSNALLRYVNCGLVSGLRQRPRPPPCCGEFRHKKAQTDSLCVLQSNLYAQYHSQRQYHIHTTAPNMTNSRSDSPSQSGSAAKVHDARTSNPNGDVSWKDK